MQKNLGQDSGWIINSVLEHTINFSKYNPLAGINYIEFPKEKEHPKKGFINIQNSDDNECFKWCLMRHLNPADQDLRRITKCDKDFAKKIDIKAIKS